MADDTAQNDAPTVETEDANEQTNQAKPASTDVPPEVKAALRKANKEAETLRLKLQEFEDRDKTEAQKLAERAEAAEQRAAELENRSVRLEVAHEKGLTPTQAKRLVGTTREELEADADDLLKEFKPAQEDPADAVVASLDLGARGKPSNAGDPAADFAKFLGGQLKAR